MNEQRTPDTLSTQAENELICEKLLGWIRHTYPANESPAWEVPSKAGEFQPTVFVTPSFTTWADAGLILEALPKELEYVVGYCDIEKQWYCGQAVGADTYAETGPLAVRAAALQYVKGEL